MNKSEAPQYLIIYNAILKKINKGGFKPDIAIPSENELALKYNVSRMTARKSIDMLVSEGYLNRIKGKGTFITGRKNYVKPKVSLQERLMDEDIRVYSKILNVQLDEDPKMEVREALSLVEEPAWRIERLRYANDIAFCIETSYIPCRLISEITEESIGQSLTNLLSNYKEVGYVKIEVRPYILKKKEAKLLVLKKDDLALNVISIINSMDEEALLYSESIQNMDVVPYKTKIFT